MEHELAIEQGLVFPKEYVTTLREEAKANRLKAEKAEAVAKAATEKAEADAKGHESVAAAAAKAGVEAEEKRGAKALALKKIEYMCERAGVKVDPETIYQDGVEAERAFKEYSEKNASVFKKDPVQMHGLDLDGGPSAKILMNGTMAQTKADPGARGLLARAYAGLVRREKAGYREGK